MWLVEFHSDSEWTSFDVLALYSDVQLVPPLTGWCLSSSRTEQSVLSPVICDISSQVRVSTGFPKQINIAVASFKLEIWPN